MLRIIVLVVAVLIVSGLAVTAVGYMLPVAHVAAGEAVVTASPEQVFDTLVDVAAFPTWRPDVKSVEVLSPDPLRWRERGSNGDITFVVEESVRPRRLVTRIDDRSLPFGGTWSYDLAPGASGTTLTITERGEVYNPVFRLMSRFVFGHTATINAYLAALTARLGR